MQREVNTGQMRFDSWDDNLKKGEEFIRRKREAYKREHKQLSFFCIHKKAPPPPSGPGQKYGRSLIPPHLVQSLDCSCHPTF